MNHMLMYLLPVSMIGFWLFLSAVIQLRECFIPIVIAGGSVCLLYIAGLINLLYPALYLIAGAGVLCLAFILIVQIKTIPTALRRSIPTLAFLLISAFLAWGIYHNVQLSFFDDATHWYMVSKTIFAENALPSTPDIKFQTYVPGVALWNYFLAQILGFSFDRCLMSQFILLAAGFCTFLCPLSSRKTTGFGAQIGFCGLIFLIMLSVFGTASQPFSLTVDILLAVIPAGALCMLVYPEQKLPPPPDTSQRQ